MGITQFISSPHAPPLSPGSTQGIVVYRVQIQGRHRWQWLPNYSIYNHQNKHLYLLWHVVSHLFLSSHPYRAPVDCLVPETIGLFPDVSTRWDSEWLLGGCTPSSHREFLHPRFSCRSFTTYLFALNNTRCLAKGWLSASPQRCA